MKDKERQNAETELTEKEKLFGFYYTGESKFNATDAATKAGYEGTYEVIAVTAHRLLKKANIKTYIIELTERRFKDAGYSIDRTTKEIMDIAFYDPFDFFDVDENGYLKFKSDIKDIKKAFPTNAISAIETSTIKRSYLGENENKIKIETWVTKLKFHDKKWALEMLSKLLEMKSGDANLNGNVVILHQWCKKDDEARNG